MDLSAALKFYTWHAQESVGELVSHNSWEELWKVIRIGYFPYFSSQEGICLGILHNVKEVTEVELPMYVLYNRGKQKRHGEMRLA